MKPEHLGALLISFTLVWSCGSLFSLATGFPRPGRRLVLYALLSIAVLAGGLWIGANTVTANPALHLARQILNQDPMYLCAVVLGLSLGIWPATWPLDWRAPGSSPRDSGRGTQWVRMAALLATLAVLAVLVLEPVLRAKFSHRGLTTAVANPSGLYATAGFEIETYHRFQNISPIQVAVSPDGIPYVCYANDLGGIVRVVRGAGTRGLVEERVASNLGRVHGLAFHGRDLYISRSGRYTRADGGQIKEFATGAVTLLRDLDGNGSFDYYQDVITGLPGSQAPDPVHQNNGLTIGPDGFVYVTVGANANRAPLIGEFEGTITRARLDGSQMSVFARGMRNPFDCAFGPDAQLFCTDNDVGYGKADELNHVVEGRHYGHPYMDDKTPHPKGSTPPIWVYRASTLQGTVYATSPSLPGAFRDRLYVASYGGDEIHRVTLHRQGETYRVEAGVFARAPGALDITVDANGVFYVTGYHGKLLYRISPAKAAGGQ